MLLGASAHARASKCNVCDDYGRVSKEVESARESLALSKTRSGSNLNQTGGPLGRLRKVVSDHPEIHFSTLLDEFEVLHQ